MRRKVKKLLLLCNNFPLITFLILSLGDEKMFLISPEINLCILSYESSQILFDSNVAHM